MPEAKRGGRRSIGVVTVARSDFGICRPVLNRIREDDRLELRLYVSGMHLAPEFGLTVRMVEESGLPIAERVPLPLASDSPECVARAMGEGVAGFAKVFARGRPDLLVVMGDRFDMYPAALAALPFKIPVAHLLGGELTQGAIDDALRHSLTKLSHLHFTQTKEYARRLVQMGEEPWRVHAVGNPGLDNLRVLRRMTAAELGSRIRFDFSRPFLLATLHASTLEFEQAGEQAGEFLAALEASRLPVLFTLPNADSGGRAILDRIRRYVGAHRDALLVNNLGTEAYFSVMALAAAMVGNSSSGVIEAASFRLPVVNIGRRQEGRLRSKNVIDVGNGRREIQRAIARALSPRFRAGLRRLKSPFGDGHSAERIVKKLASVALDDRLLVKRFHDLPARRSR